MQQYCTHIVHMHRNHTGWSIHAAANVIVSWQCMASHTYYNMTYNLSVVQFMQPYFAIWLVSWRVSWSIHAVIHCHKTCPTQPVQSQNSQVINYTRLQKRRQDLGNTVYAQTLGAPGCYSYSIPMVLLMAQLMALLLWLWAMAISTNVEDCFGRWLRIGDTSFYFSFII